MVNQSFVILLGAGASRPAGKPIIEELTRDFPAFLAQNADLEVGKAYSFIQSVVLEKEGKFDIELALQAITDLTEKPDTMIQHFHGALRGEVKDHLPHIQQLKSYLKQHIRERCQDPGETSYLRPILRFLNPDEGLDIFTLNYDPTVEALCELENVPYTDGFDPYWNPSAFQDKRFLLRLYKIHGSVFWFRRGPGRYAKLPVRGDVQVLRFFTGEDLSEMVLYPALEKDTESGPYPYILNTFREKLGSSGLIVTVGYSFRDRKIRGLIVDHLRANPDLWMLILSPQADVRRASLCKDEPSLSTRIVALRTGIEDALERRQLHRAFTRLESARREEEEADHSQLSSPERQDHHWYNPLNWYRELGHYPRIREIGERVLLNKKLTVQTNDLEFTFFDVSFRFAIEDLLDDKRNSKAWLQFFIRCAAAMDWSLLQRFNSWVGDDEKRKEFKSKLENSLKRVEGWAYYVNRVDEAAMKLIDDVDYSIDYISTNSGPKKIAEYVQSIRRIIGAYFATPGPTEQTLEYEKRAGDTLYTLIVENDGGIGSLAMRLLSFSP